MSDNGTTVAYAKISLPSGHHYVTKQDVVLGRAPRALITSPCPEQYYSTGNDTPPTPPSESSTSDLKRKRSSSTSAPAGYEPAVQSIGIPGQERVDVIPPVDDTGHAIRLQTMSRDHLRFQWDEGHGKWKLTVLGRNGVLLDGETFIEEGTEILVEDDLMIDMGRVNIEWRTTQDDPAKLFYSTIESSQSPDDLDSDIEQGSLSSAAESDEQLGSARQSPAIGEPDQELVQPIKKRKESQDTGKRGPGRPPADKVMSKEKRRFMDKCEKDGKAFTEQGWTDHKASKALKKKDKEAKDKPEGDEAPGRKSAKGRSKSAKDTAKQDRADADQSSDEDSPSKDKEAEREETPTPPMSDFTDEQLRQPPDTYAHLLHIVLTEAGKPLPLQDIYRIFKKKWPFYMFRQTDGWQSSIRHNLTQEPSIRQAGKRGKGKLWEINPEVPYESKQKKKEKDKIESRKASMPDPGAHYGNMARPGFPPSHYTGPYSGQAPPHMQPLGPHGYPMPSHHVANGPAQTGTPQTSQSHIPYRPPMQQSQPARGPDQQAVGPPNLQTNSMPVASQSNIQNGSASNVSRHPSQAPSGPPRPRPNQAIPRQPAASAPIPPGRTDGDIRNLKRQVFENFRGSLVALAPDTATKAKYHQLMNQAISYAVSHNDNEEYKGNDTDTGDVKKIVFMLWQSWNEAALNPNRTPSTTPMPNSNIAQSVETAQQAAPQQTSAAGATTGNAPPSHAAAAAVKPNTPTKL